MIKIASVTFIIFFMLSAGSCKKNRVEKSASVIGSWELREIIGGFRGNQPQTNYAPGNGTIWSISDSSYKIYDKNVFVESGSYSTGRDSSHATGRITDFMLPSGKEKLYFEVNNDTLTFYVGELVYDGTIQKYQRVSDYRPR